MWKIQSKRLKPLFNKMINHQPAHSNPYQLLPKVYVQDSSLEISKTRNLYKYKNISGKKILPFIMPNNEGFDINFPLDIKIARHELQRNKMKYIYFHVDELYRDLITAKKLKSKFPQNQYKFILEIEEIIDSY